MRNKLIVGFCIIVIVALFTGMFGWAIVEAWHAGVNSISK